MLFNTEIVLGKTLLIFATQKSWTTAIKIETGGSAVEAMHDALNQNDDNKNIYMYTAHAAQVQTEARPDVETVMAHCIVGITMLAMPSAIDLLAVPTFWDAVQAVPPDSSDVAFSCFEMSDMVKCW